MFVSQIGSGGVVELSDEHGITGNQEVDVARIRIKYGKRYRFSVCCHSNHVGELKIPIAVVFYHDALSEEVVREENEIGRMTSIMVVELLLRTQTMPDVLKKKVSMTTRESLTLKKKGKGVTGWECSSCTFINPVDVSVCEVCYNTWFKWRPGVYPHGPKWDRNL